MNTYLLSRIEKEATFLWAGRFMSTANWQHKRRTSNFHELIVVLSGTLHIQIGEQEYAAQKNTLLLIPQGVLHYGTTTCPENTSFYWLHFLLPEPWSMKPKTDAMQLIREEYPYNHALVIPKYSQDMDFSRINILCNQLLDIMHRNESNRFYLNLLMSSLLIEITEELAFRSKKSTETHKESKALSFITEWIKASLEQELTLKIIAERFNYSPAYLSRMFSREMGMTLTEYIRMQRIERAKSLLGNSSISVEEVAGLCGFHDEKYFMRCFKKQELITASQYREAFNKTQINNK